MRFPTIVTASSTLFKQTLAVICLGTGIMMSQVASATTVLIQTVMGDIEVNLYDKTTPKTVANFLTYVKANAYTNTIIHRSVSGFIVQGGGYKFIAADKVEAIAANDPVENEPVYSNVRATISMAKLGSNPNSATNQWFINLGDNSANLDRQNSGFTAFGEVTKGMDVVLAIAGITRFNFSGAFTDMPLRNYSSADYTNKVPVSAQNFVLVNSVTVLNADPDTAANLTPVKNTLITQQEKKDSSGGGSLGFLSLLILALLALGRKTLLNKA